MSRQADVEHLARPHEVVEGAQDLVHRRAEIPHVEIEQVDVVGLHPLEALLDRQHHVLAVVARCVGIAVLGGQRILGRDHQRIAPALDQLAEQLLAAAHAAVEIGGVDEVAAALDVHVDHRPGFFVARSPAAAADAERHGAERQRRNPQARAAEQAIVVQFHGHWHLSRFRIVCACHRGGSRRFCRQPTKTERAHGHHRARQGRNARARSARLDERSLRALRPSQHQDPFARSRSCRGRPARRACGCASRSGWSRSRCSRSSPTGRASPASPASTISPRC